MCSIVRIAYLTLVFGLTEQRTGHAHAESHKLLGSDTPTHSLVHPVRDTSSSFPAPGICIIPRGGPASHVSSFGAIPANRATSAERVRGLSLPRTFQDRGLATRCEGGTFGHAPHT